MAVTALTDIYNRLVPDLPGIDPYLLAQTTQDVARQFCVDTEVWKEDCPTFETVDSELVYVIPNIYANAVIHRLYNVDIEGTNYDLKLFTLLSDESLCFDASITPGTTAQTVTVSAVFRPKEGVDTLSDAVMERWYPAFVAGTKAELMSMTRKRWSNPQKSAQMKLDYLNHVALAKREAIVGFRNVTMQVKYPRFA